MSWLLEDPAAHDVHGPVRQRRPELGVMRRQDHRGAAIAKAGHETDQPGAGGRIHATRRLVQKND